MQVNGRVLLLVCVTWSAVMWWVGRMSVDDERAVALARGQTSTMGVAQKPQLGGSPPVGLESPGAGAGGWPTGEDDRYPPRRPSFDGSHRFNRPGPGFHRHGPHQLLVEELRALNANLSQKLNEQSRQLTDLLRLNQALEQRMQAASLDRATNRQEKTDQQELTISPILKLLIERAEYIGLGAAIYHTVKLAPQKKALIIGANVGANFNDPSWNVLSREKADFPTIFIEPVPPLFEKLKQNVLQAGMLPSAKLFQVAIGPKKDTANITCWRQANATLVNRSTGLEVPIPIYFSQLCSFTVEPLKKYLFSFGAGFGLTPEEIMTCLETFEVPIIDLQTLFSENDLSFADIKYVQVDVEGKDYDVLLQLPFDNPAFSPYVVVFEHKLLKPKQLTHLRSLFSKYHYVLKPADDENTVAIKYLA
jgi:FkbM family methyltransferase